MRPLVNRSIDNYKTLIIRTNGCGVHIKNSNGWNPQIRVPKYIDALSWDILGPKSLAPVACPLLKINEVEA